MLCHKIRHSLSHILAKKSTQTLVFKPFEVVPQDTDCFTRQEEHYWAGKFGGTTANVTSDDSHGLNVSHSAQHSWCSISTNDYLLEGSGPRATTMGEHITGYTISKSGGGLLKLHHLVSPKKKIVSLQNLFAGLMNPAYNEQAQQKYH